MPLLVINSEFESEGHDTYKMPPQESERTVQLKNRDASLKGLTTFGLNYAIP